MIELTKLADLIVTNFLWKTLQLTIIIVVVCWLIYDKAPGSGFAHGVLAIGVAWLLTVLPLWLVGQARRYWRVGRPRIFSRDEAPKQNIDLLGPQR